MEQTPNSQPSPTPDLTPAPSTKPAPAALTTWPGAFGAFKPSREAVRRNLGPLLIVELVVIVISAIVSHVMQHKATPYAMHNAAPSLSVNFGGELVNMIVGAYAAIIITRLILAGVRGQKLTNNQAYAASLKLYLNMFLLDIMITLSVIIGFLLFIIPGLIILPRIALAPYFLLDQNLSAVEAYKASWAATKGHVGKVWGIFGVSILMVLPVITIIGIVATVYLTFMYQAVTGLLYVMLVKRPDTAAATPAPTAAPAPSANPQ